MIAAPFLSKVTKGLVLTNWRQKEKYLLLKIQNPVLNYKSLLMFILHDKLLFVKNIWYFILQIIF